MLRNKRGAFNLEEIVMTLIVVGIFLGVAFLLLSSFMTQIGETTEAGQAVNSTMQALKTIPDYLDTIVLVAVIGIILAVVFMIANRYGGQGGGI